MVGARIPVFACVRATVSAIAKQRNPDNNVTAAT